jgi:hypothetical protein
MILSTVTSSTVAKEFDELNRDWRKFYGCDAEKTR